MRQTICINRDWQFTGPDKKISRVDLPHTWNNLDGQDGGNDYKRCLCRYQHTFAKPAFDEETQEVWLEFAGVNASAEVFVNGHSVCRHDGGYSTFRAEITKWLEESNLLTVDADNTVNDRVYPQKADFTFYGGIYRDVNLLIVNRSHFDLSHFGGPGIQITAKPCEGYKRGDVEVNTWTSCEEGEVLVRILDADGREAARKEGGHVKLEIPDVTLWDGLASPYLYTAVATLTVNGETVDEISARFGVRDFHYHPKTGFYLNGRSYPLRGVSRHQDRKGVGNSLTKAMHKEDMDLICEIGANTIRLAHYQHDQYFYDLCDERGMVVWAEIPYISEHMPNGRENTISQMKELIIQNYNHPSIVCWGVSNEITISTKDKQDMLDNHRVLNDLVHEMDKTRFTTLACYAMCGPFNKVAHITDVVSWNLYLGWYVPGLWLNDVWMRFFHMVYPDRCLGYSEYGCEGMPNLHSAHPRRGDHTEEYQAKYHEYLLKCFERNPYMWATHVWNMFDFAADARNQGGEPGMNHKGLITFDRKTKKDSFYLYKAYWSHEPFVHICSKRFHDRTEKTVKLKVYSNQG
ncbi:MAG: glycoside hydrolase family 2 protein, partial [Clostridia bacterium]|nr:glycoside hydrolase family 2 protein [Clostridia bacterium]